MGPGNPLGLEPTSSDLHQVVRQTLAIRKKRLTHKLNREHIVNATSFPSPYNSAARERYVKEESCGFVQLLSTAFCFD